MNDEKTIGDMNMAKFQQALLEQLEIANTFGAMQTQVVSKQKETTPSFKIASKTYAIALKATENIKSLKVKALKAFSDCYSDIGMTDKAAEMKQKYTQICEENNLDLPS